MGKAFIEVEESAMEVLDDFIKQAYGSELWWKHNQGYDNDLGGEWPGHPYRAALIDKQRAKKLAKAFGLYPYNQSIVHEPEIKEVA
jgi:hypothetical protein